jgi:hypothetical protein
MKRAAILLAGWVVLGAWSSWADEQDWLKPLGPPPKASPRRIAGGEGVPPLPLPATPLRRTERKREPKPPTLVAKIIWGESALFTYEDGNQTQVSDYNQCPADLQQLLGKLQRRLDLSYSYDMLPLAEFSGDPDKTALVLFNGSRTLKLDDKQVADLRGYVLRGGTILFDSIAGSPYFYASAKQIAARLLPECKLRTIPADHPLYHMVADVERVKYPRNLDATEPCLEACYVGSRAGIIISKYGLGCAWDDHEVPILKDAIYYDVDSGNKIGANLLAYVIGYRNAGREEAKPEFFGALDERHPTDEFTFAQIQHEGAWNVHPGAAAALLGQLRQHSALKVSLKRVTVQPGQDDLSGYGFLYLTGLDDFKFTEQARAALRAFLRSAGTIFINNGLGLQSFDAVARRELRQLLPEAHLVKIPPTHPIYSALHQIRACGYTPALQKEQPELKTPVLEGIEIDGDLRVIYSPYDLEAAWLGADYPLARAYDPPSGTQLGMNIAMYAMTH